MREIIDVITAIEDWIEYPPITISREMAQRIIEALEAEGYEIVKKRTDD
jgi:hypothetical protein